MAKISKYYITKRAEEQLDTITKEYLTDGEFNLKAFGGSKEARDIVNNSLHFVICKGNAILNNGSSADEMLLKGIILAGAKEYNKKIGEIRKLDIRIKEVKNTKVNLDYQERMGVEGELDPLKKENKEKDKVIEKLKKEFDKEVAIAKALKNKIKFNFTGDVKKKPDYERSNQLFEFFCKNNGPMTKADTGEDSEGKPYPRLVGKYITYRRFGYLPKIPKFGSTDANFYAD